MEQAHPSLSEAFAGSAFRLRASTDDIHVRLEKLENRERQIVELLSCEKPERIVHDLRNLLNQLQLLRLLTQEQRR